jgi:hypothetical protein
MSMGTVGLCARCGRWIGLYTPKTDDRLHMRRHRPLKSQETCPGSFLRPSKTKPFTMADRDKIMRLERS